nr:unnamed protein product [Naegleria fowleri]
MTCNPHQQDPPLTHISVHSQKKALLDETLLDLDLKMKRFHTDHPKRAKQFYFFYWLSLLRQVQEQQARKHENSILQVSSLFHDEDDDDIETTATAQVSSQQQASGGVLTTTNRMMMHHQRNAFLSSRLRFQNGVEIVFVLIVGLFFVWQWLGLLVFGGIFSKSNSRSGRGGNKIVSSHKRRLIH